MTASHHSRTVAIIQARMGSTRLPGKVMAEIGDKPLLRHVIDRVRLARRLDDVIVATSTSKADDVLAAYCDREAIACHRGDEADVVSRFLGAADQARADVIVRLTADCPFLDPALIDAVIERFEASDVDYATNTLERTYPDGLDVEVFSRAALERTDRESRDSWSRMHVTPYIHARRPDLAPVGDFRRAGLRSVVDFSHLRWTIDEAVDLGFAREVVACLGNDFDWMALVGLLTRRPDLLTINSHLSTGTGAETDHRRLANAHPSFDNSNAAFERALKTIPLASQTFSKSHYQWPKGAAPLFLDRAHGARTTDLDGNVYLDYLLGLLPIVLGHCDPDVDAAVRQQLQRGVTLSLPTLLECEVAERLVRLIPCAEKVRFGKNGSDATTAAIRLARAYTSRTKVAVAGYHGWHDWYIGTTTRDLGVPEAVKALSAKFSFNDAGSLERLLAAEPDAYAAIILEPAGATPPAPGFLEDVRALATRYGVVLVFDEIVTGFRIGLAGAQGHYGVTPDLACFGKAMANGLPLSAIVGKAPIMDLMEDVFISGTFGGEALSLAAAIATIDKLERHNVPARLWALGDRLSAAFNAAAARHGFAGILSMGGEGWWPRLGVSKPPVAADLMTSLMRQEFLAAGLLLGGSLNLSLAHDDPQIEQQSAAAFDRALAALRADLDSPEPAGTLRGELVRNVFSVR